MENELFIRILLTVIFGAILGLESETRLLEDKKRKSEKEREKSTIGGVRTYTILSLFGGVTGLLFLRGETFLVYASFLGLIALLVAAYIENVRLKEAFGMTTEIAVLITFVLGFLTTSSLFSIELVLFILVILAFFLSQKRGIGVLLEKISHTEVIDIFKFGVVTLVILPLLPNQTFYLSYFVSFLGVDSSSELISESLLNITIINPFRIWLVVVIISGINLGSYLASKIIGSYKSLLLSSLLGGFISSTSTTVALADRSKKADEKTSQALAGAAIISNAVSLISVLILLSIISPAIISEVYVTLLVMFIIGLITGLYFLLSHNKKETIQVTYKPFSIGPAVNFVALVVSLTILIQIMQIANVDSLAIFITAASGAISQDAPSIALAELINEREIVVKTAVVIFLVTNAVNFFSKIILSYFNGSKYFFKYLSVGILLTLIGTITYLFV